MGRTIFVTVGTTLFDKLISAASSSQALGWMQDHGYTRLVMQYGKGVEPPIPQDGSSRNIEIVTYRFRPTLDEDMKDADLILSHAGAGTVHEATKLGKQLVVVINRELMNNHQTELAHAMGSRRHLFVVNSPEDLESLDVWTEFHNFVPVPYVGGYDFDFPCVIDALMGFSG